MSDRYSLPIDSNISATTTPAKSGRGSNDNEEVHRIPQRSSITGA